MNKQVTLCGRCIALAKDAYQVEEAGRRMKITCAICGKRRYGAACVLAKRAGAGRPRQPGKDGDNHG